MATPARGARARADHIAATGQRLQATFARELGLVLRDAERALVPLLQRALAGDRTAQVRAARGIGVQRALRTMLREAGYDRLVQAAMQAAVEQMTQTVLQRRLVQTGVALVRPSAVTLRALQAIGRENLLGVADDVAAAVWRSLAQWLFTARSSADILADLLDAFDAESRRFATLFDTQLSMLGRQIEALATEALGPRQPFLFVGPSDGKTRRWCLDRVGKVYSRAVIEVMDNRQLPNPMVTGGGYNCRHSFLAVESDELRALMDTGRRAPEFEPLVVQAEALRRAA